MGRGEFVLLPTVVNTWRIQKDHMAVFFLKPHFRLGQSPWSPGIGGDPRGLAVGAFQDKLWEHHTLEAT